MKVGYSPDMNGFKKNDNLRTEKFLLDKRLISKK